MARHLSKNLVNFADLRLVFQVDWCIEVRDLLAAALADQIPLARMQILSHFCTICTKNLKQVMLYVEHGSLQTEPKSQRGWSRLMSQTQTLT